MSTTTLIAVVVLGVFTTGITFHLTHRVIADEGATNAAVVSYLLPVVSVLLGALVLSEDVGLRVAVGMVVVLAGVGLTRRKGAQQSEPETPEAPRTPAGEQPRGALTPVGAPSGGSSARRLR